MTVADFLSLYGFPFLAALAAATLLPLLGAFLQVKRQSTQAFAISQVALLGMFIGLASELSALLFSFLAVLVFNLIGTRLKYSQQFNLVAFVGLLTMTHLLVSISPGLESHFSHGFFGDLATMTTRQAQIALIVFTILSVSIWALRKRLLLELFQVHMQMRSKTLAQHLPELLIGLALAYSMACFGFIFTLGMTLIPSWALLGTSHDDSAFVKRILLVSTASVGLGLFATLQMTELPTTSLMIATLLVTCFLAWLYGTKKK